MKEKESFNAIINASKELLETISADRDYELLKSSVEKALKHVEEAGKALDRRDIDVFISNTYAYVDTIYTALRSVPYTVKTDKLFNIFSRKVAKFLGEKLDKIIK